MAYPIDADSQIWSDGLAAAFLLVSDGEVELHGAARRMRELYGLSQIESNLAVALARGATVKECAEGRGVSIETVRWQLKQVFAKTRTSRQPELIRLVLTGPALLR
jgi:DNA-binding CsgD family transcriptional regulator